MFSKAECAERCEMLHACSCKTFVVVEIIQENNFVIVSHEIPYPKFFFPIENIVFKKQFLIVEIS